MLFCLNVTVFFNDTATTEIYTLSLHDALPIWLHQEEGHADHQHADRHPARPRRAGLRDRRRRPGGRHLRRHRRSEEHTSELQSRQYLVCRLLLEKKNLLETRITN